MGMLSAHTPAACLPQGAKIFGMVGLQLIALETVGEDRLLRAVTKPLPKNSASVGIFVIAVGWPLTSEDAGNVETGRREDGWW